MRFMVTVQLEIPPERREEFAAKLPAENAYIAEEIHRGHLEGIYYAAGAPTVWAIVQADSLEAAQRQVEAYPLYSFMRLTYAPLR
jgi:muconolactone delta-isomerase